MVTHKHEAIVHALAGTVAEARAVLGDALNAVGDTGGFLLFDGSGAACLLSPLADLPPRSRPLSLREARATYSEICRDCHRRPVIIAFGHHGPYAQLAAFPGRMETEPTFGRGLNLIVAEPGEGKSVLAMRGMVAATDRDEERDLVVINPIDNADLVPLFDRRRPQGFQMMALPERSEEPANRFLIRSGSRRTFVAHASLLRAGNGTAIHAGMGHVMTGILEDIKRLTDPLIVVEYVGLNIRALPPLSDVLLRLAEHAQVVLIENGIPDRQEWRPIVDATQTLFYRSAPPPFWSTGSGTDVAARGSPPAASPLPAGLGQVLPPYTFLRQDRQGGLMIIPGLRTGRVVVPPPQHWLSRLLGRPPAR